MVDPQWATVCFLGGAVSLLAVAVARIAMSLWDLRQQFDASFHVHGLSTYDSVIAQMKAHGPTLRARIDGNGQFHQEPPETTREASDAPLPEPEKAEDTWCADVPIDGREKDTP